MGVAGHVCELTHAAEPESMPSAMIASCISAPLGEVANCRPDSSAHESG